MRLPKNFIIMLTNIVIACSMSVGAFAQRSPGEAEVMADRLLQNARSYYNNLEMESMEEALQGVISISQRFGYISPRFASILSQTYIFKGLLVFINSEDRVETKRLFAMALQASPTAQLSDDLSTPTLRQIFEEARQGGQGGYPAQPQGGGYPTAQPQGGYPAQPQGGYPAQPQGGYPAQPQGGYPAQPQGGYPAQPQGGYPAQPQGGYPAQPQGGYPAQPQGGYPAQPQGGGYPAQPTAPQQPVPSGPDISHTPPAQLPSNRPFTIRVKVSTFLRPQVSYVHLYYVSKGTSGKTQRLDLRPDGPTDFEGQLPGVFITGDRLQYYIVLLDQSQNPVANFMDYSSPQVVRIVGGQYSELSGGLVQDKVRSRLLSAGLSAGAGTGTVSEGAQIEGSEQQASGGFAISGFHLKLNADFWVIDSLSVGLGTRVQIDRQPNVIAAFLVGGTIQWAFVQSEDDRWIARVGGGYGKVAHLVPVSPAANTVNGQAANGQTKTYLTIGGPVFYQVGLGYSLQISDLIALSFGVDFMHFIGLNSPPPLPTGALDVCPVGQECDYPSKHFDLNIGIEFTL